MNHTYKCKMQNYKIPERNMGENLDDLWHGNDLLDATLKAWFIENW